MKRKRKVTLLAILLVVLFAVTIFHFGRSPERGEWDQTGEWDEGRPFDRATAEPSVPRVELEMPEPEARAEAEIPEPGPEPERPEPGPTPEPEKPVRYAEPDRPIPVVRAEPEISVPLPPAEIVSPWPPAEPEILIPLPPAQPDRPIPVVRAEPETPAPGVAAEPEIVFPLPGAEPEILIPLPYAEPVRSTPVVRAEPAPERDDPEAGTSAPAEPEFETFVVRRIPKSTFRSIGEADRLAILSEPTPTTEREPAIDSFVVREIPVSDFPAALTTHRRIRQSKALASAVRPIVPVVPTGAAALFRWDYLALRSSAILNRPQVGEATHTGRHGLSLVRILSLGRLDLEADAGDNNGELYLARGYLGIRTHGGWSGAIGDQNVGYGSPGFRGTTARGIRIERGRRSSSSSPAWKAGAVAGRVALDYANLENGSFPRRLEAGFFRVEQPQRQTAEAIVYHLADRNVASVPAADALRDSYGVGLSGSLIRSRLDLRGEFVGSATRLEDGSDQNGQAIDIRGRGNRDRLSFSGRLQGSRGEAFEVGHFGTRQLTPRDIQEATLNLRTGAGTSVSGWGGRWRYPPNFLADSTASNTNRHSIEGNRWGGRVTWRSARTGTGWSSSAEERRRVLASGSERVLTLASSVSQKIRRGLQAALAWNRIDYSDRPAHTFVTGSASFRLGRSGSFTLQQRTFWQEPLGLRLETIADVSSIRLLGGRLFVFGQLALTHEEKEEGGFRRAQTQSRVGGDLRLGRDVRLSGRYQRNHSGSGDVHSLDFTLTHSLGGTTWGPPTLEQMPFERQIVTGRIFEDRNRDGLRQEDEPGIPGIEVAIDGDSRAPVVTDVDGVYRCFLLPGRHSLRLLPASVPTTYTLDGVGPAELEVLPDRMTRRDFPLVRRVASVQGLVFDDRRGTGMSGVKIHLEPGRFTYTDENGTFRFEALPAGEYELRIDVESLPFGYRAVGVEVKRFRVDASGGRRRFTFHVTRPVIAVQF